MKIKDSKKAANWLPEVGLTWLLAICLIALLASALTFNLKKVEKNIADTASRSYANSILLIYLNTDISACSIKEDPMNFLLQKGNLTFADIIGYMASSSPIGSNIFARQDLDARFNKKDEPVGKVSDLWFRCTKEYFSARSMDNLGLSIYYNGNRDYFATFYDKETRLVGEAQIPSAFDKNDILTIRAYELK